MYVFRSINQTLYLNHDLVFFFNHKLSDSTVLDEKSFRQRPQMSAKRRIFSKGMLRRGYKLQRKDFKAVDQQTEE